VSQGEGERRLVAAIFGRGVSSLSRSAVDALDTSIDSLARREAQVVRMRYGLGCGDPMTQRAIGERVGLSAGRIGQIQARALRKLRHPIRSRPILRLIELEPEEGVDPQGTSG
jgi:RNA polymerase primary sigma factor